MRENWIQNAMNTIELSEQDKERIMENCLNRRHVNNKVLRYSKQIAAVMAVGIVSASSLTVYAAVSAYQAYMEQMSEEEVQERFDNVQNTKSESDKFSRPLVDSEREALDHMRTEYQEGLRFPEQSMVCFDGATSDYEKKEDELAYDYINGIFYIPERELTEDELLQIIDVWEKANYSLEVINEELTDINLAEKAWELYGQELSESDEAWLKQAIYKIVKDISGEDASDLEWEVALYGSENPKYIAKEECNQYSIMLNPDSTAEHWSVDHYCNWSDVVLEEDWNGYTEEELTGEIEKCAATAVTQLADTFGIDSKVVKCQYGYNQNVLSGESTHVEIVLTTETEDRYRLDYAINTATCKEMICYEDGKYDDIDILNGFDVVGEIEMSK